MRIIIPQKSEYKSNQFYENINSYRKRREIFGN